MTDKRVFLQAKGEVQKVGYRDFVQKAARKLGIVGYVENMRDGSVRVVCEGEEASIEEFTKTIKVKVKFIDVEEINIIETGEPTGEFEYFDIKRGDMAEELGERLDVSILYLDATKEELKDEMRTGFCAVKEEVKTVSQKVGESIQATKEVGQKVENMHTDLKEGFKETKEGLNSVEGAISGMNSDMNDRFDTLDDKYGAISQQMNVLTTELQTSTKSLVSLTEKIGALIDQKLAE